MSSYMRRQNGWLTRASAVMCILVAAWSFASCGGNDATGPGTVNARVFLDSDTVIAPSSSVAAGQRMSSEMMGAVTVESVDSLMFTLLAVGAILPADTINLAASFDLSATARQRINFRKLPVSPAPRIELGSGSIPTGRYSAVRVRFSSASITLNTAVTSRGVTFEPGTYPLEMTHGITYAADVPVDSFTVTKSSVTNINITFDLAASIASVKTSADGKLEMTPIFRATTTH